MLHESAGHPMDLVDTKCLSYQGTRTGVPRSRTCTTMVFIVFPGWCTLGLGYMKNYPLIIDDFTQLHFI